MKRTDISAGAILLLSIIYFFGGFSSLCALLTAISVHETGHIAAILVCGGTVHKMRFGVSGLCIDCSGLNGTAAQIISLLAGCTFGLLLAYTASYFGNLTQNTLLIKTAGFSLVLSIYNILPALPLDGGRALQCALNRLLGIERTDKVLDILGVITGAVLLFSGAVYIRTQFGPALLIAGIWVLIAQTGIVKSLCVM